MTTASTPTAVQALAAVMNEVQGVGKDGRNTDQNYSFRGIDGVMNAVGPALRKHGVVVLPVVEECNYRDVQTSRGKPSRECTVRVRYVVHGPAGDTIEGVTAGESMDFGDKGTPKAMSVAFRTFLLQALCIPTHEPDPDAQTYERDREPEFTTAPPQQPTTDPAWLDEIKDEIHAAPTVEDAKAAWQAAKVKDAAQVVAKTDMASLSRLVTDRLAALREAAEQTAADEAARDEAGPA